MAYQAYIPVVNSAEFSANPARINARIVLTVRVTDALNILEPEIRFSGEVYAGEV